MPGAFVKIGVALERAHKQAEALKTEGSLQQLLNEKGWEPLNRASTDETRS